MTRSFYTAVDYWTEKLHNDLLLSRRFNKQLNIGPFYSMIDNLDPDLSLKTFLNLDINIRISENKLVFDIHYKPTNSFNYLNYTSCHPPYKEQYIAVISKMYCYYSN